MEQRIDWLSFTSWVMERHSSFRVPTHGPYLGRQGPGQISHSCILVWTWHPRAYGQPIPHRTSLLIWRRRCTKLLWWTALARHAIWIRQVASSDGWKCLRDGRASSSLPPSSAGDCDGVQQWQSLQVGSRTISALVQDFAEQSAFVLSPSYSTRWEYVAHCQCQVSYIWPLTLYAAFCQKRPSSRTICRPLQCHTFESRAHGMITWLEYWQSLEEHLQSLEWWTRAWIHFLRKKYLITTNIKLQVRTAGTHNIDTL